MGKLKIALQKKGRLHDESLQLLKDCGLRIENGSDKLKVSAGNFPMEIFFLRSSDIPQYIEDGVADIGIVGENLLIEKQNNIPIVKRLGFSKCRLSLAFPKEVKTDSLDFLEGKKIATSYPNTLNNFLFQNGIDADIHIITGSVEIAPNIGLSDGICDIVSSGNTLFKNGLKESLTILESEAVLVSSSNLGEENKKHLSKLIFRINAIQRSRRFKYVLMNVPNNKINEVSQILPVLKSPTVLPLALTGWSSLHSVIEADKFWDIIDLLTAAGAEDILIVPIDKMIV